MTSSLITGVETLAISEAAELLPNATGGIEVFVISLFPKLLPSAEKAIRTEETCIFKQPRDCASKDLG